MGDDGTLIGEQRNHPADRLLRADKLGIVAVFLDHVTLCRGRRIRILRGCSHHRVEPALVRRFRAQLAERQPVDRHSARYSTGAAPFHLAIGTQVGDIADPKV